MFRVKTVVSRFPFNLVLALFLIGLVVNIGRAEDRPRVVASFDRAWKFHLGEATGADQTTFDDKSWRTLDIPHDWMIEGVPGADQAKMDGPFDPKSPAGADGAFLDGGIGWYRKTFTLPASAKGKQITILFDGAYMDADIYLNGQKLGNHPYGFTSFFYDLTAGLKFGGEKNVIAVRLNVQQPSCRWYSGAGLYRHVWLITTQPVHVATWGTYLTTPKISATSATVHANTRLENAGTDVVDGVLTTIVLDPAGHEAARSSKSFSIPSLGASVPPTVVDQDLTVSQPQLWSPDTPALYHAVTEVRVKGTLVDSVTTPIGIRTLEFTKDKGFLLNGQHVQIKGACDHADLGCLGSAALKSGYERQLKILKEMGCNALRTSHNPPSPELLDLCDQMGIMVMDECFDEWKQSKRREGYGRFFDEWSQKDLTSMLRRDRNHPSIIIWSIGNEIPEATKAGGSVLGQPLVDTCHREDPTRPVTSACPRPLPSVKFGFDKILDVFGINYQYGAYTDPSIHGVDKVVASETASTVDSRGEYGLSLDAAGNVQVQTEPDKTFQMTSYDLWTPGASLNAEAEEVALQKAPWVAGEFIWTGFDYLGEPSPYRFWPARSSEFGASDLCGFPKDRYYMYQSQWSSKPMVHILPHWTWPGFEGKSIPVSVYSNADTVELFLNGRSLGVKHLPEDDEFVDHYVNAKRNATPAANGQPVEKSASHTDKVPHVPSVHLAWSVPYEPGELKAVATKGGQVVATDVVRTAGPPAKITLTPDRTQITANGQDLSFIKVTLLDKDGNVCPNADNEIEFTVNGSAADLAGVDNGDPTNHESFQGPKHKAFHGLGLAVLRSHVDTTGAVTLTASAPGLSSVKTTVNVVAPYGENKISP